MNVKLVAQLYLRGTPRHPYKVLARRKEVDPYAPTLYTYNTIRAARRRQCTFIIWTKKNLGDYVLFEELHLIEPAKPVKIVGYVKSSQRSSGPLKAAKALPFSTVCSFNLIANSFNNYTLIYKTLTSHTETYVNITPLEAVYDLMCSIVKRTHATELSAIRD